jgi:3',5'-cyclic AMP phosphodiesterase CpdA
MFVLAHLSDPHLAPLPTPRLSELASKRLLGFLNWRFTRFRIHRADVLERLVQDLKNQSPGHTVVTGDLVNISLPDEFANAQAFLKWLGPASDVTVVPGNHDAYVRSASDGCVRSWADYMRGDTEVPSADAAPSFPFVRRRGPIALIGVSTAVPTPPFAATGLLGPEQIARLSQLLEHLGTENLFRILLIHHPPAGERPSLRRLTDAHDLVQVLKDRGAELVLHGHDHIASLNWLPGPRGRIAVIGVPSASASADGREVPAAYNLYRIKEAPGSGWLCEVVSRGFHAGEHRAREIGRQRMSIDSAAVRPQTAAGPT